MRHTTGLLLSTIACFGVAASSGTCVALGVNAPSWLKALWLVVLVVAVASAWVRP